MVQNLSKHEVRFTGAWILRSFLIGSYCCFFRKSHNDQVPTENTVQYDMVSYGEYALITIAASWFEKDHVIQSREETLLWFAD